MALKDSPNFIPVLIVFIVISQAAIGSIALDRVRETLPEDQTAELYGVTVLCVAVLAIIVTSPPGAALISLLGPKLLDFK